MKFHEAIPAGHPTTKGRDVIDRTLGAKIGGLLSTHSASQSALRIFIRISIFGVSMDVFGVMGEGLL